MACCWQVYAAHRHPYISTLQNGIHTFLRMQKSVPTDLSKQATPDSFASCALKQKTSLVSM